MNILNIILVTKIKTKQNKKLLILRLDCLKLVSVFRDDKDGKKMLQLKILFVV